MHIQWNTTNELGEKVTHNHPTVNTENAYQYAKKNCHTCWGVGFNSYDNGWQVTTKVADNGNIYFDREPVNQRFILCDCAIRNIERNGL